MSTLASAETAFETMPYGCVPLGREDEFRAPDMIQVPIDHQEIPVSELLDFFEEITEGQPIRPLGKSALAARSAPNCDIYSILLPDPTEGDPVFDSTALCFIVPTHGRLAPPRRESELPDKVVLIEQHKYARHASRTGKPQPVTSGEPLLRLQGLALVALQHSKT